MSTAEPLPSLADLASEDKTYLTPEEVDALVAAQVEAGETDVATIVQARWCPADEGGAAWAMDHLHRLNDELGTIARHREELEDRIEQWFRQRTKNAAARAAFFEAALKEYGLRWYGEDDRRRTLPLPDGGAVMVRVPKAPTVSVGDEPAVMKWARAEASSGGPGPQDCIKTVEPTLLVSEVRKWVKAVQNEEGTWVAVSVRTGAVVPGIHIEPPGPATARVAL